MEKPKLDEKQSKALREARKYIKSLELGFKVHYGEPELFDIRPEDERFMDPHQPPTHYRVGLGMTDSDGTHINLHLLLEKEKVELSEEAPTKEQIQAAMDGERQHYVLVIAKDAETAARIAEAAYRNKNVASVDSGNVSLLDSHMVSVAGNNIREYLEQIHEFDDNEWPDKFMMKPKEKQRRETLKSSALEKSK